MAILNKIRQRSLFLILIIALALFSFVLADVFRNGGADSSKQNRIATINGEDLDKKEFDRKVEQQLRNLGSSGTTTRAVNAVWDQEVNRMVLEGQYEELGIRIGKDRLADLLKEALQNDARFQDADGFYSEAKMQEFIATLKDSKNPNDYQGWVVFEESLADTEKQNIYYNLVKAGLGATLKDGEVAYRLDGNSVDIQFVQVPYASIPDEDIAVSKSEIESYINSHKEDFQTGATRNIRFVKFEEKATLEDENALKESMMTYLSDNLVSYNRSTQINDTLPGFKVATDLKEFLSENSDLPYTDRFVFKKDLAGIVRDTISKLDEGAVYGPYKDGRYMRLDRIVETRQMPDSVQSRHILLSYQGALRSSETRTEDEAKKLADSILGVIKKDKSSFDKLAAEFSSDASNKNEGGDLGFQNPNLFAAEFRDYIVDNPKGSMDVVKTDFGYHVIEVTEQKNFQKAFKIASIAKEIVPSDKTISDIYTQTQKFEIAAGNGDFEAVAIESAYNVRPVNNIGRMDENLPGEGSQRTIVQWAFEEDAKVGDIKRFQVNNGYIVAQITRKVEEGLQRAEDASARVLPIIRKQKKAAQIKEKITGTTLDAIAQNQNQTVKTSGALNMTSPNIAGAGDEPKVVGVAFGLNEGDISDPIEGERGVYVIKVTKKTEAPVLENYGTYAAQQAQKARAAVTTKVIEALKAAADIEDNRGTFY
ncbi:peptidylprolyl isomerase [uncultured Dokdonia sp.]|uniref:peptidylprolyl isomerase n=1 Tax=uncultured Dokdonia sp. TaxID=575653 RepID=UPI00262B212E|nr:peptidylprolyl isomerase [uncultured Dokdonia sp.]